MAATWKELNRQSRTVQGRRQGRTWYSLWGEDDITTLRAAFEPNVPQTFDGLDLYEITYDSDRYAADKWIAEVRYEPVFLEEVNVSISVRSTTVQRSLNTEEVIRLAGHPSEPPNNRNQMNWDHKTRQWQGGQWFEGSFDFSVIQRQPISYVENQAFIDGVKNTLLKVNDAAFRFHARGEVLFVGMDATKRQDTLDYRLEFRFLQRDNKLSETLYPGFVIPDREGWWLYHDRSEVLIDRGAGGANPDAEDTTQPVFGWLERMAEYEDFPAKLGVPA